MLNLLRHGRALRGQLPDRDDLGPRHRRHPGRRDRLRGHRDALHQAGAPCGGGPRQVARLLGDPRALRDRCSAAGCCSWPAWWAATPRRTRRVGLALLLLEGTVLLTLALAGGTRLSTLANGVTVFGLYGLAFVGGWMEQIGTIASNATARYIGIAASLLVPSESLWQLASHHMQPPDRAGRGHRTLLAPVGAEPGHGRLGGGLRARRARPRPAPLPHPRPLIRSVVPISLGR